MLTIEQCRGARGLLSWTQQELADASGLSKTAINNFEKGHSDIKVESLRAIRMAFESAEIEFIEDSGLRKKSEDTKILKGADAMGKLLDDIHLTLTQRSGEILISNVDNTLPSQISTQKLFDHIELLKSNDIRQRVLCAEGSQNILSPDDECRWLSQDSLSGNMTTFIYGNKVAFQLWDKSMIMIINSQNAKNAEHKRFEHLWSQAEQPEERLHHIPKNSKSA